MARDVYSVLHSGCCYMGFRVCVYIFFFFYLVWVSWLGSVWCVTECNFFLYIFYLYFILFYFFVNLFFFFFALDYVRFYFSCVCV